MSEEIKDLMKKGLEGFDIVTIISERWNEKTFVVSYILEQIEKEKNEISNTY